MAKIDFPVATADGQIFVADTNVIYTYVGNPPAGYWSGFAGADSANLGDTFVKVAGDNMTGNLTLGTDKITLNADGSAQYEGRIFAGGNPSSGGAVGPIDFRAKPKKTKKCIDLNNVQQPWTFQPIVGHLRRFARPARGVVRPRGRCMVGSGRRARAAAVATV